MPQVTKQHLQTCSFILLIIALCFSHSNKVFAQQEVTSSIYVSNAESNSISRFSLRGIGSEAKFELVQELSFPSADTPSLSTPMALTNDKKHLYAVSRNKAPMLYRYSLNEESGELNFASSQAIKNSYAYIALSPNNEALYGASYPKHLISNYALKESDNAIHQQSLGDYLNAHAIAIDSLRNQVLLPALGENRLHQFSIINKANSLLHTSSTDFPEHSGPRHLVLHPNAKALYVIGEFDAHIYQLAYNTNTEKYAIVNRVSMMDSVRDANIKQVSDNAAKPYKAADIKMSQDGRLVFATERRSNSLCSFLVNPVNFALSKQMCVDTESWPRGIQIADAHNVVIAAGKQSHHVSLYQFDEQGNLTYISRHETGQGPNWIEVLSL